MHSFDLPNRFLNTFMHCLFKFNSCFNVGKSLTSKLNRILFLLTALLHKQFMVFGKTAFNKVDDWGTRHQAVCIVKVFTYYTYVAVNLGIIWLQSKYGYYIRNYSVLVVVNKVSTAIENQKLQLRTLFIEQSKHSLNTHFYNFLSRANIKNWGKLGVCFLLLPLLKFL